MEREIDSETHSRAIRRNQMLSWGFAVLALLLAGLVFYAREKRTEAPQELVGTWKTDDPKYSDRYIEIGLVSISFGTGDAKEYTGFIQQIDSISEDGLVWYTIRYTVDGQDNSLSFTYSPGAGHTIRLRNEERIVWSKQRSP